MNITRGASNPYQFPLNQAKTQSARQQTAPNFGSAAPAQLSADTFKTQPTSRLVPLAPVRFGGKSKVVIASNRGPGKLNPENGEFQKGAGGLVTALLRANVNSWFFGDEKSETPVSKIEKNDEKKIPFDMYGIQLTPDEQKRYYEGFSNSVLWPVMHGDSQFIRDFNFKDLDGSKLAEFDQDYGAYKRVNQKFADIIARETTDQDLTWLQDYHLMLAPEMIRKQKPDARLGFFSHIPFPSLESLKKPEMQAVLPKGRLQELMRGVLGSNLIGFHTKEYADNFTDCVKDSLGEEVDILPDKSQIAYQSRNIKVGAFPISVDVEPLEAMKRDPALQEEASRRRAELPKYVGLGVDRLDYTKGIPERLEAVEKVLQRDKQRVESGQPAKFLNQFKFIQVAAPSRSNVPAYKALADRTRGLAQRINDTYGTPEWKPIYFREKDTPFQEIVPWAMKADFGLVTPHKDGMNLVAKELPMVQDKSTLILSKEAGAAQELGEHALLVDPTNPDEIADSIERALEMPEDERARRTTGLQEQIRANDIHKWRKSFIDAFEAVAPQKRLASEVADASESSPQKKTAIELASASSQSSDQQEYKEAS